MDVEIIRRLGLVDELDLPAIIALFGKDRVLQAIAQDETLRTTYLKTILQTLDLENVLKIVFPDLTDEEKKALMERISQRLKNPPLSPAKTTP